MRAEKARRSFKSFVEQAWSVLEPETEFVDGIHVDAVCSHLQAVTEGRISNLGINIPPGHAKSLLTAVFWPAWAWIDHPETRWLFSSYSASLSVRDSVKCRRLIESPWYQSRWGDRFKIAADQNEKSKFENSRTGYRLSTSVGGTATGERGDIIVVDDPTSVTQADSDKERVAANEWWNGTMQTRLNDLRTGHKVVIQQRLHDEDLTGMLLKQGTGYDFLILPAEFDPNLARKTSIGWEDPRTTPGQLLWPDKIGQEELDELKTSLGSYRYAGQYQQRPSPAEGGMVKRTWWQYYDTVPDGLTGHLISLDAAFKGSSDSDFVVIQVWAKKGSDFYLLDQDRGRWAFPDTQRHFLAIVGKWPQAETKIIEAKANGQAIIDSLRGRVSGLIGESPHESKEARVAAVSALIEAGNVHLPKNEPWAGDFVEEFAQFPNGSNDDQVDCCTQALKRLRRKTFERVIVLPR